MYATGLRYFPRKTSGLLRFSPYRGCKCNLKSSFSKLR
jgi:hypothetical protein